MSKAFSFIGDRREEFSNLWDVLGTKTTAAPSEHVLKEYLEIIQTPEGDSRREIDLCHIKRFLTKKRYHIKDENFANLVEAGDIIEVNDLSGTQLFRTLEFFSVCSYTLEELATENWVELYERPQLTIQLMVEAWTKILQSNNYGPHRLNIPKHVVKELRGEQNHIECEMKYGWILYDEFNNPVGVMDTLRARILPNEERKVVVFKPH